MKITDTHIYFYSGKEIYSNWNHSVNQFFDPLCELHFDSTEQAFMYYKAIFFRDLSIAAKAAIETNPAEVKKLGRLINRYNDKAWECVRLGYMAYVNLLKFQQNKEFARELSSTSNKILVEASPYDRIWGVGLDENNPLILDEKTWNGRNLLGQALMTVRGLL